MVKLIIEIEHEFEASPFLYNNDSGETLQMTSSQLKKLFNESDASDFSINVAFLDPLEGWPVWGFDMSHKNLCKGGKFTWHFNEIEVKAAVKISGELASNSLRPGIKQEIEKKYKNSSLRLSSFNYKQGEWSGFRAPILGQGEEDFQNWYEIKRWRLK